MKIEAREVRVGMKILDRDGYEIDVEDAWPDQGPGLGIMVIGTRVSAPARKSINRYIDPSTHVEVISNG